MNHLDKDIEDCHLAALRDFSTTYIDPQTGFTVFTELLHLQRGKCCGNQCRHCPYGWTNVPNKDHNTTGETTQRRRQQERQKEVSVLLGTNYSAEESRLAIQNRIQQIKALSSSSSQQQGQGSTSKTSSTTTSSTTASSTGGRKGGRKTSKNVPYTRSGDAGTSQLLTGERRSKADLVFEAMGTVDELCSITGIVHSSMLLLPLQLPLQQSQSEEEEQSQHQNDVVIAAQQTTTTTTATTAQLDDDNDKGDDDKDKVDLNEWLLEIMSRLFDIGTHIANPQKRRVRNDNDSSSDDDDNNDNNDNNINGVGGGFDPAHIDALEDWIDIMTEQLPVLHSFVLPTSGTTMATSHLHQARCVCRRAERTVVQLVNAAAATTTTNKDKDNDDDTAAADAYDYYYVYDERAVKYLNRLSDFYFTAARWVHYDRAAALGQDGEQEEILYRRQFRGAKQRHRTTQKNSHIINSNGSSSNTKT